MSNLFVSGMSGLQAFRQALDVTGQNIANANTDGYVRQRAELVARESTPVGTSWVGNGVEVSRLARVMDDFLADQSRVSQSNSARLEVFAGQAARVSNLLGYPSGGLSNALQRLNNALEAVATEPGSMTARQGLVETLDFTVSQIRGLDSRLRDLDGATHSRIVAEAATVDGLVGNLATLNRDIGIARATANSASNGLLDQRDRLLDQLAAKVSIRVVGTDGGAVNVYLSGGQSLVFGYTAVKVATINDPADFGRSRLVLRLGSSTEDVTRSISAACSVDCSSSGMRCWIRRAMR